MLNDYNLKRFLDAQEKDFNTALSEIKRGRKQSHWMWYIFPQIQGLGFSATSTFYAITDLNEAAAFLEHKILGERLVLICKELLKLESGNAGKIFGSPDDMKLKSCMTLFASIPATNEVFLQVLKKFFNGAKDIRTLQIIDGQQ